jgi:DNA-binding CsgD family transcriptional regulator
MSVSEEQLSFTPTQLSDRELEILRLVATGASNKEIASQLFLSPNTVKVHLRNIFAKIGVQSRTEATMYAVRQGWVDVPADARAQPMAEELETAVGAESQPEAVAGAKSRVTQPRIVEPPLPWPQRVALVVAVALVLAGLGVTWPRAAATNGEVGNSFRDLPGSNVPLLTSGGDSRWQPGSLMPTPRGRLALASLHGKLYAIGGIASPGGVTGAVEVYDAVKNTWSSGASKPTPVANVAAAALNGKLIVPGGYTSSGAPTSVVEVYDPAADVWSSGAALPSPVFAYALAVYDGKLYLFGGTTGRDNAYVGQTLVYDPTTERWTARAPMPTPRGFAAAETLDKAIYVVGGYDGRREFDTCERYWPDRDAWESCAPLTVGRGGLGLAAIAGRLYAVGGGWSGYLAFGERYDPAANVWSPVETPLAGQWRNLAVAVYRTDLFAMGGWNGQSYLAVTEKYSPFPFQIFIPSP